MIDEAQKNGTYGTWKTFVAAFKKAFTHVDPEGDARSKLKIVSQNGTVEEYNAEFRSLVAKSGIKDDNVLMDFYYGE